MKRYTVMSSWSEVWGHQDASAPKWKECFYYIPLDKAFFFFSAKLC